MTKYALIFLLLLIPHYNQDSHADECIIDTVSEPLRLLIPTFTGAACVDLHTSTTKACVPNGKILLSHDLRTNKYINLQSGPRITNITDECVEAEITTRTRDHTGMHPNYRCTPAVYEGTLSARYCR